MAEADFVYESPQAVISFHWGNYIRDFKVTDEGMPVITEASKKLHKDVLKQYPDYFNKKENGRK